jgi:hypothetical protein
MAKKETINVKGTEIALYAKEKEDYISLIDIAKYRDSENPSQIISLWLRTYSTIEYLGLWERLIRFIVHICYWLCSFRNGFLLKNLPQMYSIVIRTHRKNISKYQQMGIVRRLRSLYFCRQF